MAIGFRKSMFGFNCGDVMNYIEASHKKHGEREEELRSEIASLTLTIETLRDELSKTHEALISVTAAKTTAEAELQKYNDKYEEIDRLSNSIGKLYLVAQANAKSVMASSAESLELSRKEVRDNIESIENAHSSLDRVKEQILETSSKFAADLESLMASLEGAKAQIDNNDSSSDTKLCDVESILSGSLK